MRWPAIFTRKQPATDDRHAIIVTAQPDPLLRCQVEIDEAVRRRAAQRASKPARSEAKRFAHARPKVDQLVREMAMAPVEF